MGEDKRPLKKKNSYKDSIGFSTDRADSLRADNKLEIKNWITETSVEQNLAKKTDSAEKEEIISQEKQNTDTSLDDSLETIIIRRKIGTPGSQY